MAQMGFPDLTNGQIRREKLKRFLSNPKTQMTLRGIGIGVIAVRLVLESINFGRSLNEEGWGG